MLPPITNSAAATASPASATPPASTGADFQTFLSMLTAQIKNQDPLNPMEGSDFAVQLATFSGVEQQVRTNQLLESLSQGSVSGLAAYSEWIGQEARVTGSARYDGTPLTLNIAPDPEADDVRLIVHSDNGGVVSRELIGPGRGEVDWQGGSASGVPLPPGNYRFEIESLRNGEALGTTPVSVFTPIARVEAHPDGARLGLAGGRLVHPDEITALRQRH